MCSQFIQNTSRKSPHVLLRVSFEKMCFQCCLEDTDCCAGSDIVWSVFQAFAADTVND